MYNLWYDVINLSTPCLQPYQHQFTSFSPFCKRIEDKNIVIKDKRKHYDAVDKRSLEQFCKSDVITFAVYKFWSYTPSTTGSYGRLAGW